ncbi:hypothetical protein CEXT_792591 [Caerostris extrusa]|uniref:Uncharacterized protein n=1 Tax=Caerostris extrusa TaxID=172846 RepID=A0AAV4RBR9_CAEEX|nr:hypothetical protein CEXT_792591 [Caerostris extrusa]
MSKVSNARNLIAVVSINPNVFLGIKKGRPKEDERSEEKKFFDKSLKFVLEKERLDLLFAICVVAPGKLDCFENKKQKAK